MNVDTMAVLLLRQKAISQDTDCKNTINNLDLWHTDLSLGYSWCMPSMNVQLFFYKETEPISLVTEFCKKWH